MNESELTNRDRTVFLDLDQLMQHESRHPYLVIYSGNHSGCLHRLRKGTTTIGRAEQADLTIGDSRISDKHCIIEWLGNEITIEDTDSTNGIYVDSQKVRHAILPAGVPIQLGQSIMKIEYKNETDIQSENMHMSNSSFDKEIERDNVEAILNDLICEASQALQIAKERGKNRTESLL